MKQNSNNSFLGVTRGGGSGKLTTSRYGEQEDGNSATTSTTTSQQRQNSSSLSANNGTTLLASKSPSLSHSNTIPKSPSGGIKTTTTVGGGPLPIDIDDVVSEIPPPQQLPPTTTKTTNNNNSLKEGSSSTTRGVPKGRSTFLDSSYRSLDATTSSTFNNNQQQQPPLANDKFSSIFGGSTEAIVTSSPSAFLGAGGSGSGGGRYGGSGGNYILPSPNCDDRLFHINNSSRNDDGDDDESRLLHHQYNTPSSSTRRSNSSNHNHQLHAIVGGGASSAGSSGFGHPFGASGSSLRIPATPSLGGGQQHHQQVVSPMVRLQYGGSASLFSESSLAAAETSRGGDGGGGGSSSSASHTPLTTTTVSLEERLRAAFTEMKGNTDSSSIVFEAWLSSPEATNVLTAHFRQQTVVHVVDTATPPSPTVNIKRINPTTTTATRPSNVNSSSTNTGVVAENNDENNDVSATKQQHEMKGGGNGGKESNFDSETNDALNALLGGTPETHWGSPTPAFKQTAKNIPTASSPRHYIPTILTSSPSVASSLASVKIGAEGSNTTTSQSLSLDPDALRMSAESSSTQFSPPHQREQTDNFYPTSSKREEEAAANAPASSESSPLKSRQSLQQQQLWHNHNSGGNHQEHQQRNNNTSTDGVNKSTVSIMMRGAGGTGQQMATFRFPMASSWDSQVSLNNTMGGGGLGLGGVHSSNNNILVRESQGIQGMVLRNAAARAAVIANINNNTSINSTNSLLRNIPSTVSLEYSGRSRGGGGGTASAPFTNDDVHHHHLQQEMVTLSGGGGALGNTTTSGAFGDRPTYPSQCFAAATRGKDVRKVIMTPPERKGSLPSMTTDTGILKRRQSTFRLPTHHNHQQQLSQSTHSLQQHPAPAAALHDENAASLRKEEGVDVNDDDGGGLGLLGSSRNNNNIDPRLAASLDFTDKSESILDRVEGVSRRAVPRSYEEFCSRSMYMTTAQKSYFRRLSLWNSFKLFQSVALLVAMLVTFSLVSIRVAIGSEELPDGLVWVEGAIDITMACLFLTQFVQPVEIGGHWETDTRIIIKHYLKGCFLLEFISMLPLQLIMLPLSTTTNNILYRDFSRISRVLLVKRLPKYYDLLAERLFIKTHPFVLHIAKLLLFLIVYALFTSAPINMVVRSDISEGYRWLAPQLMVGASGGGGGGTSSILVQYLRSYLWSVALAGGRSFPLPVTDEQVGTMLILSIFSIVTMSVILSGIVFMFQSLVERSSRLSSKIDATLLQLSHMNVDDPLLVDEIITYYSDTFDAYNTFDYKQLDDFLDELPEDLECLVSDQVFLSTVKAIPLFSHMALEDAFVGALAERLSMAVLAPGTIIYLEGERSPDNEMFFLSKGIVSIVDTTDGGKEISCLTQGDTFGEESLLYNLPRQNSIVARIRSVVFILCERDIEGLSTTYPQALENILSNARDKKYSP